MKNNREKSDMVDVFRDTKSLKLSAETIKKRSTNKTDITTVALSGLALESCREILDLGCAFGFFTKALKSRVHPKAHVTGIDCCRSYEDMYLKACVEASLEGNFDASGIAVISEFGEKQYDLILCSYALYFFPEMIPDISRILKSNGIFVTITHSSFHLIELINYIKDDYKDNHMAGDPILPVEKLADSFSDKNGYALLSPWFADIRQIRFKNTLEFTRENFAEFMAYVKYKRPFFFSKAMASWHGLVDAIEARLLERILHKEMISVTKDDIIFICTEPLAGTIAS